MLLYFVYDFIAFEKPNSSTIILEFDAYLYIVLPKYFGWLLNLDSISDNYQILYPLAFTITAAFCASLRHILNYRYLLK
jgi:hypothetical protein